MLQSRKFYIFQRALRRYARTVLYYSKAIPLAKEFTERVIARWERSPLEVPPTNFIQEKCKRFTFSET